MRIALLILAGLVGFNVLLFAVLWIVFSVEEKQKEKKEESSCRPRKSP